MLNAFTDTDLVILLSAGGCSLATTAKKDNWVDHAGSLPDYICKIAKAVKRDGKSTSAAIAIAVSRVKKWAAGGDDVDADTRAKAAKAVAQWEALKAKAKGGGVVKASRNDGSTFIALSNIPSYNMNLIRTAWEVRERSRRKAWEAANPRTYSDSMEAVPASYYPYRYIRETWTDFLIVENEDGASKEGSFLIKVPFTVDKKTFEVTFGEETAVKQVYKDVDIKLTANEQNLLSDLED